jgi:putative ABC transport system substrate-binding protein
LKEAVPNLRRVAVLSNPNNPTVALEIEAMRKAALALALELAILSGERSKLEASLAAIATAALDGLVITDDAIFFSIVPRLASLAIQSRLPNICGLGGQFVRQGGLMSYSANWFEAGRRAAHQVARILNGAHPADLPIDQTTGFALAINLKTARQLGLTIPGPLLARADEVIE